jgi:hypothetical protein
VAGRNYKTQTADALLCGRIDPDANPMEALKQKPIVWEEAACEFGKTAAKTSTRSKAFKHRRAA